jgi:Domain of unknown function (DUF4157)
MIERIAVGKRSGSAEKRVGATGTAGRTRPRHPAAASRDSRRAPDLPHVVHEVLAGPGQALDHATRASMEQRFGYDFGGVRIHTDTRAAESARAVHARAFTVGRNIVFGAGQFAPPSPPGRKLLGHELTHVVQQRHVSDISPEQPIGMAPAADPLEREAERREVTFPGKAAPAGPIGTLDRPRLQRSILGDIGSFFSDVFSTSVGPITAIKRAFGSEDYSDQELQDYLKKITKDKQIEDRYDSDNKARAIVARWMQRKQGYVLSPQIRVLLIREMQSGATGDADERAILTILRNSSFSDLQIIFGSGGIDPKDLDSDFQGAEEDELHAFYDKTFEGGTKAVLSGRIELKQHVKSPYQWTEFKLVIEQRIKRIETAVGAAPEDDRDSAGSAAADTNADEVYKELLTLTDPEREQALKDIAGERVRQATRQSDVTIKQGKAADEPAKSALKLRKSSLDAVLRMLDLILEGSAKDVAIGVTKKDPAAFRATTTPLSEAQKKAAREALKPVTQAQVEQEVSGAPPGPAPKFVQKLPEEPDTYDDQIRARAPKMIDEMYADVAAPRGEAEHKDPVKTHKLAEMEPIANASKQETDHVFGNFKTGPAFKADKFNAAGILIKKGNIHDVWASEQSKRAADPSYQSERAQFWMFYLMENDTKDDGTGMKDIEFRHNAVPSLDANNNAKNPEAKVISEVGKKYVKSDAKRLFEIGRGWDAFAGTGEVSLQLFKKPDAKEDRRFLWDTFFTLIHEYMHTLESKPYDNYAQSLGGESTNEGNTLIEGVDCLLTETVWASAKDRASRPEVRNAVEPDAAAAGEPFDASLLPIFNNNRYDTYPNAVKLVSIVGIRNLYAAYFNGDVKLIGGK